MGKALRTTLGDLADELRRRGRHSAANALDGLRQPNVPNPRTDDTVVRLLLDIIDGKI